MNFTAEQDTFLATNRYSDVEANKQLFPVITHPEYVRRRKYLRENGADVPDLRGRPSISSTGTPPKLQLPTLFNHTDGSSLWGAVEQFQQQHRLELASHILTDVDITIETDKPFGLCFMSDWHIGNIGTDHEALMRDIDLVNSCDRMMAYVGGDPIDNFIPEKLAHAARETQIVNPGFQWKMYRHAIERIMPSLLAVGRGNHDAWTQRQSSVEGIDQALAGIPVLHTGEDTYLDLTVGEQKYTIYRKHRPITNSRIHRTAGAKMSYDHGKKIFDVGVTEHHHEAALNTEMRHGQYRWFIATGSYKVSDMHAREWGYQHGGIGTPCVIFWPHRRKIVGLMDISDAIQMLEM